jgi:hypothetical protein
MVRPASMMKKIFITLCFLVSFASGFKADAQMTSISTDLVKWGYLGTANIDAGFSVAQHFSISTGIRCNPWEFKTPSGDQMNDRQMTAYVGARYWPWYVFSGWWVEGKLQYSDFSRTGVWRPALEKGMSVGAGLSFGYTLMLHEHLNLEFGAGLWGGRHLKYGLYECPVCMRVREEGPRNFIRPDNLSVSLMYIF